MAALTVLASGPIDPRAEEILRPYGRLVVASDGSEASLLPLMGDAVALVVRGGGVATSTMMAASPHLRVIGRSGAGCDSVDLTAATARGIPVVFAPGFGGRGVAEASVTMILALLKRLFGWHRAMRGGNWNSRFTSHPRDLAGAVVGIVGLGAIGSEVATLLRPFEARLLGYDPHVSPSRAETLGVQLVAFESLLQEADVVALHAPLTPASRGMINRRTIGSMKPGTILVNFGRGALIESLDVLCEGLDAGHLAGVGLDVFDPEPPDASHPFFSRPDVIVTPHVLGTTQGAMRQIFESMALDMAAVLSGGSPRHVANAAALAQR